MALNAAQILAIQNAQTEIRMYVDSVLAQVCHYGNSPTLAQAQRDSTQANSLDDATRIAAAAAQALIAVTEAQ